LADIITIRDEGGPKFSPHPEGQMAAVCVDVVDLGERLKTWGAKPKVSQSFALVFITGERRDDGHLFDVSVEFTASMFEQAKARQFLEAWRGRAYTEEEAKRGVPLHKLVGQNALLSIVHRQSQKGRTYATIGTIMPLPKRMAPADVSADEYVRPSWFQERKEAYAAELANFRRSHAAPTSDDDYVQPTGGDDDLPF
jgi:hypothetical protein